MSAWRRRKVRAEKQWREEEEIRRRQEARGED